MSDSSTIKEVAINKRIDQCGKIVSLLQSLLKDELHTENVIYTRLGL